MVIDSTTNENMKINGDVYFKMENKDVNILIYLKILNLDYFFIIFFFSNLKKNLKGQLLCSFWELGSEYYYIIIFKPFISKLGGLSFF